ncbi:MULTISPECIES: sigma 54-interacting transcriptional regulator [unclassified Janthinobacterium]|uniref:sigma 54-interacting transcriptional regulator n=1 Tax=unclassified Janthinobacterium TaxID=2610881 RepID=UPI001615BDF6|nr:MULTISPECIES: sigma 54-interacting transcriptional regulator [unclassified Janthinobacterium]MBB5609616.1 two-component system response regulator GlrR [Janthinobacterium sp. S3T4]MBB5614788.1 two-component system response regulator GlrR [Janthinobacterium sp. S3M3]
MTDQAHTNQAHILLVDDDPDLLRLLTIRLKAGNYRVTAVGSAEAALARLAVELPALVITDVQLPGRDGLALFDDIRRQHSALPVILLTAHGTIPDAVDATARGAFAYLTKPFDGKLLMEKVAYAVNLSTVMPTPASSDESWRAELISRSAPMAELLAEARLVAGSDASILIRGASGTGKELLARALHNASRRAKAPFIAVNCGAIPEQLLESELFGHVKGSFTGAVANREGLFQAADGGTLFLDEIGDMPLPLQVKLLRVLQERAVRPVGADRTQPVDVRLLSATHRDLDVAMAEGQFREDLYYRLNVVTLVLPPLAERREDIALLANHFLQKVAAKYQKPLNGFAPDALTALVGAPWPGNVRQLFNVVEQVCALATAPLVPLTLVQRALRVPSLEALSYNEAKQRFERDYLVQLLRLTDGNVADAARLADRNRTEFYRLLQKYELTPALFRGDGEPVAD